VRRKRRCCRVAGVAIISLWLAAAGASGQDRDRTLSRTDSQTLSATESAGLRLLQVRGLSVATVRAELEGLGIPVLSYLPDQGLLVAGPEEVGIDLDGVIASNRWTPTMAVSLGLTLLTAQKAEETFPAGVPVILGLAPETPLDQVVGELAAAGASVSWTVSETNVPQIGLRVSPQKLGAVMNVVNALQTLVWADLQPPVRLHNLESVWRCQSGERGEIPVFDHGIFGEGQVVGVTDTGLDIDHCLFDDPRFGLPALNDHLGREVSPGHRKVLAVDFYWGLDWPNPGRYDWDDQSHGTHVAGSVAGDLFGDGRHQQFDGMAPAAKLVIQDGGFATDACSDLPGLGCPLQPLGPVLQQTYDQGARIHTNSWGDEEESWPLNRYTERTADVDRFIWDNRDFLVFFGAGNAGGAGVDTVISPSTGKNVVAVGATERGDVDPPCVAGFSSRGWVQDGRIKPDLVVPGSGVVSSLSDGDTVTDNCDPAAKSGTSMASPTAAGLGALVRQYFEDGYYPSGEKNPNDALNPSGALVKATLISSAVDLTTLGCGGIEPIPSRDQGWGLVQLDRALYFSGDEQWLFVDDHNAGFGGVDDEAVSCDLELPKNGPFKVVLVWTDPPSNSLAAVNLVNDLDLVVTGPDETYQGNVFSEGVSVTGGVADRLNNVEVVFVPEARGGHWAITVVPHHIAWAGQDFALVVVGPVAEKTRAPRRVRGRRIPGG
jgi:subtilisin family serine protease